MKKNIISVIIILVIVTFLSILGSSETFAQTTTSDFEKYIITLPAKSIVPPGTDDLRQELEAGVSDLIAGERYAPLYWIGIGKGGQFNYFLYSYETFYALSLAYPYLSPNSKNQVKVYLANEYAFYPPFNISSSSYPIPATGQSGKRREFFDIASTQHIFRTTRDEAPEALYALYSIWSYAYFTDSWSIVQPNWNLIKNIRAGVDPSNIITNNGINEWSVNRRVAGLIGYARIASGLLAYEQSKPAPSQALIADYQAEYGWGLQAASQALQARYNWEVTHRPTDGQWEFDENVTGQFLKNTCCGNTWIPRYQSLVPEIGKMLFDFDNAQVQRQNSYMDTIWPLRYLTFSPQNRNEVNSIFPDSAMEHFVQKAFLMQLKGDTLRQYIGTPWSKGDLYYVQKLAYAIRAYEGVNSLSVADINQDNSVNVLDIQACVNHILGIQNLGNSADANQDGSVDVLDVQVIVNLILEV